LFTRKLPDWINPLAGLVSHGYNLLVIAPSINDRGISQTHQAKDFNFANATSVRRQEILQWQLVGGWW